MKKTILPRLAALTMAAVALIACSKQIDSPSDRIVNGEIRTLCFGLAQQDNSKTTLDFSATGVKVSWNAGDRIAVIKGDAAYIYELESTAAAGIGTFNAVGKGVPDLSGNTEKVCILHVSGQSFDNVTRNNLRESICGSLAYAEQTGNGTTAHIVSVLSREVTTPPVKAEDLEGTLTPVNSILNLELAAPALEAGEYPTAFILTAKSWNTSFASSIWVDGNATIKPGQRCKKLQVKLKDITVWDASNPLKVAIGLMMDEEAISSGADSWIFEVQTNKHNIYSVTKTIKNKPARGSYYAVPAISGLTKDTQYPCWFADSGWYDMTNAIEVSLSATFSPHTNSCTYGQTYLTSQYSNITIEDESGNIISRDYVGGGKGGGKGGPFEGVGSISARLRPGTKYYCYPSIYVEDGIEYYGARKELQMPDVTISTDQAVDLGTEVLWASWNVGATKAEEPGGYYAWGETEEQTGENAYTKPSYKYFTTYNAATYVNKYLTDATHTHLGIGAPDNLVVLEDADDVARKEWGGGWRMPLKSDIKDLFDKTSALDDYEYNGVKGVIFLGKNEYKDRCIFIPHGGFKSFSTIEYPEDAFLWTATLCTAAEGVTRREYIDYAAFVLQTKDPDTGSWFFFSSWQSASIGGARQSGRNVRPVKEKPSAP